MNITSNLNPNVVKTALDEVFMQEFDLQQGPGIATAETAAIFRQETITNAAQIGEIFQGSGMWFERAEEQDVAKSTPRFGNKYTYSVVNFANSVEISKNFFDDNMHGAWQKIVRDFAENARVTRDMSAFEIFRGAFTTTLSADGVALCSDSHVTLSGGTVDNALTAALSPTSLNTAIVMLREQKAQDGTIKGSNPSALLVPSMLFKTACEIVDSEFLADTADNNINVYSSKYAISVFQSPYLGAAAGGKGLKTGSNTAWFLLGRNHSVTRWVRQGVELALVDWRTQRNNNYIYKGEFREVFGAPDYNGIVGSTGVA